MDQPWQIELFGWLRATQGDRVVARFRTHRASSLLAYLAYYVDRSHPRDALIELLWPGSDRHLGRISLRTELTSLRHQLEPPGVPPGAVLLTDRSTLRLNPTACVTDVALFEAALAAAERSQNPADRTQHLIAAVERYRGELLPGWFEDWVLAERQRLAEAFLRGLHELVGLLEAQGNLSEALRWARRAVASDPLGEESHHRLIRLLLASGQVEAARAQFEQGEELLLRELGTGLSPEIRASIRDLALVKDRPPPAPEGKRGPGRRRRPRGPDPERLPASPSTSAEAGEGGEAAPSPSFIAAATCPSDNLPLRFTRFFGREREIEQLGLMLRDAETRLLTLTGPGGTGKTRLALQAAERLRDAFPGGVWFVSLLDLTDPALIPDQALQSMRLPRSPRQEALEQVVSFLSRAPALLLLDNFEHVIDGGAETAQTLLERVGHLTVLVTSRQCLGLEGEREYSVSPLTLPVEQDTPAQLLACESVRLFVDRAQAARPDFQVTAHNAAAVAALCQQLEGLPLSIELAAARSGVLTPQQMLSRLDQRFDLLVGRQRSADPRHRSLRAAVDWSYQLLTPELQRFFARLSIFRGGWTLEAAEAVCEEPRALGYLEHLRECSLVQAREATGGTAEPSAGVMRFHLLETLREYGSGCLSLDERRTLARRHLQFFLGAAAEAERHFRGSEAGTWLDLLQLEHDNYRAALAWAGSEMAGKEGLEPGLQLAGRLVTFWAWRGYQREGQAQLLHLLALPGAELPTLGRAMALRGAGQFAYHFGDWQTSTALYEECLAVCRHLNDPREIALTLESLGWLARHLGDAATSRALLEESLAIHRQRNDPIGIAGSLNGLARVALIAGEWHATRALAEEGLAIGRQAADWCVIAGSLEMLGGLAMACGELPAARERFRELLAIYRQRGDQGRGAVVLNYLAFIACDEKDLPAARALSEQCLEIQRELRSPREIAFALQGLGGTALDQRDLITARAAFEESLAIHRSLGDQEYVGEMLNGLAEISRREWDLPAALSLAEEGLAVRRKLGDPRWIADSLHSVGWIQAELGNRAAARALHEECLGLARERRDPGRVFRALDNLGSLGYCQGDLETARARFVESLAIATELEDRSLMAKALTQMGRLTEAEGDYPAASAFLERALSLWRELDESSKIVTTLHLQGWLMRHQRDYPAAYAAFGQMLASARERGWQVASITPTCLLGEVAGDLGDWQQAAAHYADAIAQSCGGESRHPLSVVQCLSGMARVALARSRPVRAARLLGAAAAHWKEGGPCYTEGGPYFWEVEPGTRSDLDRNLAATRARLEEAEFAAAWAEGQAMSPEQAVAEALQEAPAG